MKKFFNDIEKKYPFIISIIVSIGIIMWFRGIIGIIDLFFMRTNSLFNYLILMGISLLILYFTNVGVDVIFDIEQRRKINNLLKKDGELLEEDKNFLIHQIQNHHKHSSTVLYPTLHSF